MSALRRLDSNQRPLGYDPNELPYCSTPRYYPHQMTMIPNACDNAHAVITTFVAFFVSSEFLVTMLATDKTISVNANAIVAIILIANSIVEILMVKYAVNDDLG